MSGAPASHLTVVPDEPQPRRLDVTRLSAYQQQATDWLWKGRIPAGELTVLAGDGGLGKSTFAAWLAAGVTSGRFRGLTGTRRVAVVLGEDDPARTLKPRFGAAGAGLDHVAIVNSDQGAGAEPLILPDDLELVARFVAEHRPDLLVVDPVTAHLNGAVDAHRDGGRGGMRQVLNPLSRLAQAHGTTVLAVFHLNKGSGPAAHRIGGSAGIRNAARNVLVFAQHPEARQGGDDDGRRIIGHDKCNYGPAQPSLDATIAAAAVLDDHGVPVLDRDGDPATTSVLEVGEESLVDYADALRAATGEGRDDGARDLLAEAVDFLRVELADGEVPVRTLKSLAADAGHAWRTVERAFSQLGVKSAKRGREWVRFIPATVGGLDGDHESPGPDGDSEARSSATPPTPPACTTTADLADMDGWEALL